MWFGEQKILLDPFGAVIGHKTGTSNRDERGIFAGTNDLGFVILPYHTMGVVKYEQLGIPYKLEGVPQMDTARMPELRNAVMAGMKKRRAELRSAIG